MKKRKLTLNFYSSKKEYNSLSNYWNTDVVITDGTLQREIENLKLEELHSNRIILYSDTDTNTCSNLNTINQNKVSLKVSSSSDKNEENNYSIILPSRKPKIGDILVVIDDQGNTDWISFNKNK